MKKSFLTANLECKYKCISLIVLLLRLKLVKVAELDQHQPDMRRLILDAQHKKWIEDMSHA